MQRLFLLFCLVFSSFAHASDETLDHIDIYLHTVDRGESIYDNFAHTAIRVHDRSRGSDLVYNWGIFDFSSPVSFVLRFYRGEMLYRLGVYPYRQALAQYRYDARRVWEDKLRLTDDQKRRLLEKLSWNAREENREYLYDFFLDNCSTRPRDYINYALDGEFEKAYKDIGLDKTYRVFLNEAYAPNQFIQVSTDLLGNHLLDKSVDAWGAMFHPLELRHYLLELNEGNYISTTRVLEDVAERSDPIFDGFQVFSFSGLIAFFVPSLFFFLAVKRKEKSAYFYRLAYRFLGIVCFVLLTYAAALGLSIFFASISSGVKEARFSFAIFLFWPSDFILLPLAWHWMRQLAPKTLEEKKFKFYKRYFFIHIALILVIFLADLLGSSPQSFEASRFTILPVYFAIYSLMMNYGIQLEKKN